MKKRMSLTPNKDPSQIGFSNHGEDHESSMSSTNSSLSTSLSPSPSPGEHLSNGFNLENQESIQELSQVPNHISLFLEDLSLEEFVERVVEEYKSVFCSPPIDQGLLDTLTIAEDVEGEYKQLWPGIVQLFSPSAHRITAFVKRIPGFSELADVDQIVLLRGCVMDVLFFRMGIRFDCMDNSLPLNNGLRLQKSLAETMFDGNLWPQLKPLFETAEKISDLNLPITGAALAIGILAVEADRIGVQDVDAVYALQRRLMDGAKNYLISTYPYQLDMWQKMMMQIASVRAVSDENSDRIINRIGPIQSVCQLCVFLLEDAF